MIPGVFVKAIVWGSTKTWDIKNKKNVVVVHLVIVLAKLVSETWHPGTWPRR